MNVGSVVPSTSTEVASPVKPGYEPPGMMEVRDKYGQLKEVMGTFNDKVSKVLSDAENQFLQAYRAHMTDVHRELQMLRSKLAEAETSLQKDEQIQSLERDCVWYVYVDRPTKAAEAQALAELDHEQDY